MNKTDLVVIPWIGCDFRALDSDTLCNSRQMIMLQRVNRHPTTISVAFEGDTQVVSSTQSESCIYTVGSLRQRLSHI